MAAQHTAAGGHGEVPVITGLPCPAAPTLSFHEVVVDLRDGDAYNEIPA
jgi:hypothetical protein